MADFDYSALHDDPEIAFVQLEKHFREQLMAELKEADNGNYTQTLYIDYINNVVGAATALGFDFFKDWQIPSHRTHSIQIYDFYRDFSTAASNIVLQINIASSRRTRRYTVAFSAADKERIRHLADRIKSILDAAALPVQKKDDLFKKLNTFLVELDKTRTTLESIADFTIGLSHIGGEAAKELEPAVRLIGRILRIFGRYRDMEDAQRQVAAPKERLRIEPPKLRLPAPDEPTSLDDEIPF